MRILLVGAGGVGGAFTAIAARRDLRMARPKSRVHTLLAKPYSTPFAQRSASPSSENFWTVITGPKISDWICSSCCWSPETTVGS